MLNDNVVGVSLIGEMKSAYGDYAMAVLLGRAIPSLYDGLKPAARRVMTGMKWLGLKPDGRYMKSARIEGEVMGKLHPHGGAYGVMVTNATTHNNNHTLIDGWGNWGSSVDGAAAARYTECKLSQFSWDCLLQHTEVWQTQPNYDGSLQEPVVMEAAIPYVLVNGQEGIGVGFATRILPHNLRGIAKAVGLLPKLQEGDVMEEIREQLIPDFPTGCEVIRDENLEKYLLTGSGSVRCRAKAELGTLVKSGKAKNRATVTFTNLPPTLDPEKLGEQIKNAVEKGTLEGVAEVRDESDMTGDRVVVVGKVGVKAENLLPDLYHCTALDTKISAKTLVIEGTTPTELSPAQIVERWFDWRMDRLSVQFSFEKDKREARLHIVTGLLSAIDQLDAVIAVIRAAKNRDAAKASLCKEFGFSDEQAVAILEMRLRQLTNLDKKDLLKEKKDISSRLKELNLLISDNGKRQQYLLDEVDALAIRHGNARRSPIVEVSGEPAPGSGKPKARSAAPRAASSRCVKIDRAKGLVSTVKGPRGAVVLAPGEKLVTVSADGLVRKLPHSFKGPVSSEGPVALLMVEKEERVRANNYLVVFTLDGEVRSLTIAGDKLCGCTSKGKRFIPAGAELISFGEPFTPVWVNTRKKKVTLVANPVGSAPGGKGKKICTIEEITNV